LELGGAKSIDWEKAFSNKEIAQDPIIDGAIESTQRIASEYWIIYLTGRSEKCQEATFNALTNSAFGKGVLFMRQRNDIRPDEIIKRELIQSLQESYQFIGAIDDDYSGRLQAMYEACNIPHVYTFDEFFNTNLVKGIK